MAGMGQQGLGVHQPPALEKPREVFSALSQPIANGGGGRGWSTPTPRGVPSGRSQQGLTPGRHVCLVLLALSLAVDMGAAGAGSVTSGFLLELGSSLLVPEQTWCRRARREFSERLCDGSCCVNVTGLLEAPRACVREPGLGRAEYFGRQMQRRGGVPVGGPLEHRGHREKDVACSLSPLPCWGTSPLHLPCCVPWDVDGVKAQPLGTPREQAADTGNLGLHNHGAPAFRSLPVGLENPMATPPDAACWMQQIKIQKVPGKSESF